MVLGMFDVYKEYQTDILLLVDLQEGFCNKETETAFWKTQELLVNLRFPRVVASKFVNVMGGNFERLLGFHGMFSDEEQKSPSWLLPYISFACLKTGYSAVDDNFVSQLKRFNRGKLPSRVCVAGVDTEACVLKTAIDLFELGIRPIVFKDCCASSQGKLSHDAGLLVLRNTIGEQNVV